MCLLTRQRASAEAYTAFYRPLGVTIFQITSSIEQLLSVTMNAQLVRLQVQGIAGILVDTSRAHDDNVRVSVRVLHEINIHGASSLSRPLKISPTENPANLTQRHIAVWFDDDDPIVFEAREGQRFQLQICVTIAGKGNFPIGAGNWELPANGVYDVLIGCVLASDKRRSIAYCIDSRGGAILRVMAASEDRKAGIMSAPLTISTNESFQYSSIDANSVALRDSMLQHRSRDSFESEYPLDLSIERVLTASFDQEAEPIPIHSVPSNQESAVRHKNNKSKSRFVQFFRKSITPNKTNRKMSVGTAVSPATPATQGDARNIVSCPVSDRKESNVAENSRRSPFWASPKTPVVGAAASRPPPRTNEIPRQNSPAYSPTPRFPSQQYSGEDDGFRSVGHDRLERSIDEVGAIVKNLFPAEQDLRTLSGNQAVKNEEKAPRPLMLYHGKVNDRSGIYRQQSEDSEPFSDVFDTPLTKMRPITRPVSPRPSTPSSMLDKFGPSVKSSFYRTQSPTAVWESTSSRTPSPVEPNHIRITESPIPRRPQPKQHLPPQPKMEPRQRAIPQYRAIPVQLANEKKQELYRLQQEKEDLQTFSQRPESKSSPSYVQNPEQYSKKVSQQRQPNANIKRHDRSKSYPRKTQHKRFDETCLNYGNELYRSSRPESRRGLFTCGTMGDDDAYMYNEHMYHGRSLDDYTADQTADQESATTTDHETLDTDTSETDGRTASEPPPDFLFCQGDGSYFCKPVEDEVLRRRRLWKEKMRHYVENNPTTVGEEEFVDSQTYLVEPRMFASGPLTRSNTERGDYNHGSTSPKLRSGKGHASFDPCNASKKPHGIRSDAKDRPAKYSTVEESKKSGSPTPPTLGSWSPQSLLEENAKTIGQSIVALVEPFAACATVRPPDHSTVPLKVPSTIRGDATSVGELTATSYERQIDKMRRQGRTSNIQETLRSSQKSASKLFGFGEDAMDIRTRTSSVSTKSEDYFSDYKGLQ